MRSELKKSWWDFSINFLPSSLLPLSVLFYAMGKSSKVAAAAPAIAKKEKKVKSSSSKKVAAAVVAPVVAAKASKKAKKAPSPLSKEVEASGSDSDSSEEEKKPVKAAKNGKAAKAAPAPAPVAESSDDSSSEEEKVSLSPDSPRQLFFRLRFFLFSINSTPRALQLIPRLLLDSPSPRRLPPPRPTVKLPSSPRRRNPPTTPRPKRRLYVSRSPPTRSSLILLPLPGSRRRQSRQGRRRCRQESR